MKATAPSRIYLAVIGPSDPPEEIGRLAEEVGAAVARAGAVLLTGGMGGAMEAASRGARRAGGTAVGILPGVTREGANPFLDVAIPTGMGEMRNALLVRAADGVIAVGGGVGTLSEIALALKLGKPLVGLRTWTAEVGGTSPRIDQAKDGEEAVGLLLRRLGPAFAPEEG